MLDDIKIKKGTEIWYSHFINTHNPKYFSEPLEFKPERWLETKLEDSFAFAPFFFGAHNCLGQHLAIMEIKLMLCEFVRRYNFKYHGDFVPKYTLNLTYAFKDPLFLDLTKRVVGESK